MTKEKSLFGKVLIVIVIAFAMLVGEMGLNLQKKSIAYASGDVPTVWNGSVATAFAGGDGLTKETAFEIATAEQLAYMADRVNNAYGTAVAVGATVTYGKAFYKLTADIVLNDETFSFDEDRGLMVVTNGTNIAYLGTGVEGLAYGINGNMGDDTDFDSAENASTKGLWYNRYAEEISSQPVAVDNKITIENMEITMWTPIGYDYSNNRFSGNFDGGGKSIKGLYVNRTDDDSGLFGAICSQSYDEPNPIGNVQIQDALILGGFNAGILAGFVQSFAIASDAFAQLEILNCSSSGYVFGDENIGGLIGGTDIANITNCYNTANVFGNTCVGGLVGNNESNYYTIENCYNIGQVRATENFSGSLIGSDSRSFNIINCFYLEGSATDGNGTVQIGVGEYDQGQSNSGPYYSSNILKFDENLMVNGTQATLVSKLNEYLMANTENLTKYKIWKKVTSPTKLAIFGTLPIYETQPSITNGWTASAESSTEVGTPLAYQWYEEKFVLLNPDCTISNTTSVSETYTWAYNEATRIYESTNGGIDNSTSVIVFKLNATEEIEFSINLKVSSEPYCDSITLYMSSDNSNWTPVYGSNGERDWNCETINVPANTDTYLKVAYEKDDGGNLNDDKAWFSLERLGGEAVSGNTTNTLNLTNLIEGSNYYLETTYDNGIRIQTEHVTMEKVNISYNYLGIGGTDSTTAVFKGAQLHIAPSDLSNAFAGWWTKDGSANGDWGTRWDENAYVTEAKTLYAKWVPYGAVWNTGTTNPTIIVNAKVGDLFLNTETCDVFKLTAIDDGTGAQTWILLCNIKGATGTDGINGADGTDGQNGINGKDGLDGKDGKSYKTLAIISIVFTVIVIALFAFCVTMNRKRQIVRKKTTTKTKK